MAHALHLRRGSKLRQEASRVMGSPTNAKPSPCVTNARARMPRRRPVRSARTSTGGCDGSSNAQMRAIGCPRSTVSPGSTSASAIPLDGRSRLVHEPAAELGHGLVGTPRVVDARGRQPERRPRDDLALEDAEVAQHVRQAAPRELVHGARDQPGAPELRRDDRLALRLRDRREVVVAGGVEEVDVRVPGLHRVEHRLALRGVVDGAHVRAGDDPRPAAARVHLDDHLDEREEHGREEVREHLVGRPVGPAGERAVEVRARRPEARVRLRRLRSRSSGRR